MGETTKISWADHTWNPFRGCAHATLPDGSDHPGCTNCYAEAMSKRNPGVLGEWGPNGTRVMAVDKTFNVPLKWDDKAEANQQWYATYRTSDAPRPRVFVNSLSDIFEDWEGPIHDHKGRQLFTINGDEYFTEGEYPECRPATMDDLRARVFSIIDQCPNLDFLILTKRPENVLRMWPMTPGIPANLYDAKADEFKYDRATQLMLRPNVWLLASASDQPTYDAMAPYLWACRDLSPVIGWSLEPLLGGIKLWNKFDGEKVRNWKGCWDWVITGGESGPHARAHDLQWSRDIGRQCREAGVAWFHKQMGSNAWIPNDSFSEWPNDGNGLTVDESTRVKMQGELCRVRLTDRAGADPSEWGEGWLQQMPKGERS